MKDQANNTKARQLGYWSGKKRPPRSAEWSRKISEAKKGTPAWNRGKTMSEISPNYVHPQLGKKGHLSPNWKGGVASLPGYKTRNRKKFRQNTIGSHTLGEWELLKRQYGNVCPSCFRAEPSIILTQDHIIPISKGGSDYIENIQPLCRPCNSKKSTKATKFQLPII